MKLHDAVAVVTGAGSGIGQATALSLAQRGCHLALVDISAGGLAATVALLHRYNVRASQHVVDIADRQAIAALPEAVLASHGRVNVLINNAGVALGGTFEQISEADFDWLMRINFDAVVSLCRVFLPLLRQAPEARLVNVSSVWGLVAPPEQSAYAASKFAVRGFSNALRHELDGTGVGVTVVHPGGVRTAIAANAKTSAIAPPDEAERGRQAAQKLLRMQPGEAGEIIVKGIERNQARVLVGRDAKIVSLFERLMPVRYWKVLGLSVGRS